MNSPSRGLLAGLSVDVLQRRTETAPYREVWQRLNANWLALAARDAATPEYLSSGALGWHSVTLGVVDAGLAWHLTRDPRGLDYVQRCIGYLVELCEDAQWREATPTHFREPVHSYRDVALAADLCRDGLAPDVRQALCRIVRHHILPFSTAADTLRGYSGGNNIQLCRNLAVGTAALTWGEESGVADWQQAVRLTTEVCRQYLRRGVDAAGNSYEGTGYAQNVFLIICAYAQLLCQGGGDNLFATEPKMRQFAYSALRLLFPSRRSLVNVGDVGIFSPPSMPWLLLLAKHYRDATILGFWDEFEGPAHPDRPCGMPRDWTAQDNLYLALLAPLLNTFLYWDAEAPKLPVTAAALPTADYSPGTEIVNLRTGWGRDAVYVNLLGSGHGHVSYTHYHADSGHFSIFAYGEYLAIDTGRYNFGEDQHSVMLVDGLTRDGTPTREGWSMSQRPGRCTRFLRHPLLDYACIDSSRQVDAVWADRHFLFVRLGGDDGYLVVLDNVNKDHARHSFWWQLQAHPASTVALTGARSATVTREAARLDISFAIPGAADFPKDPHRLQLRTDEKWWSWPYGRDQDISRENLQDLPSTSHRRPRLVAELTGVNGVMAAVIVPRRAGAAPLAVRQIPERRALRLEIDAGVHVDTVFVAFDHGFVETTDGWSIRSELAFVRRDKGDGRTSLWTSDDAPDAIAQLAQPTRR